MGEYKEWRREIAAIKHSYNIEDKDFAGLIFLAIEDDALDLLWNIDPFDFTDNPSYLRDMMDMLNLSIPKPGHPTCGSDGAHGGTTGRGRAELDADRTVRPGNKSSS